MKAEFVRDICLGFHDVTEEVKWGHDLCFMIRDKMFCITGIEGEFGVSFKVKVEDFEELTGREDIIPAPYLARYKWVHINKAGTFNLKEWDYYLRQSYDLINAKADGKAKKKKQL